MAFGEGKYPKGVNPLMNLKDGEPYFFIRGQDSLAPVAIEAYAGLLEASATAVLMDAERSGAATIPEATQETILRLQQGATDVRMFSKRVAEWQAGAGRAFVKLPD